MGETQKNQPDFFENSQTGPRQYLPFLTAVENEKGVLDVDTVKGCTLGMRSRPDGGCYGECYAAKTAARYGINFRVSVSRKLFPHNRSVVFSAVQNHYNYWYRIGVAGDPCHDWDNTIEVIRFLRDTGKIPVIITKHWVPLTGQQLQQLAEHETVFNTSVSAFDSGAQLKHRTKQIVRIKRAGMRSIARVVTCKFGQTKWGKAAAKKQSELLSMTPIIDNPLRASKSNPHVLKGDIILTKQPQAIGGGKYVSLHDETVYLGTCDQCLDQCGAIGKPKTITQPNEIQLQLKVI